MGKREKERDQEKNAGTCKGFKPNYRTCGNPLG